MEQEDEAEDRVRETSEERAHTDRGNMCSELNRRSFETLISSLEDQHMLPRLSRLLHHRPTICSLIGTFAGLSLLPLILFMMLICGTLGLGFFVFLILEGWVFLLATFCLLVSLSVPIMIALMCSIVGFAVVFVCTELSIVAGAVLGAPRRWVAMLLEKLQELIEDARRYSLTQLLSEIISTIVEDARERLQALERSWTHIQGNGCSRERANRLDLREHIGIPRNFVPAPTLFDTPRVNVSATVVDEIVVSTSQDIDNVANAPASDEPNNVAETSIDASSGVGATADDRSNEVNATSNDGVDEIVESTSDDIENVVNAQASDEHDEQNSAAETIIDASTDVGETATDRSNQVDATSNYGVDDYIRAQPLIRRHQMRVQRRRQSGSGSFGGSNTGFTNVEEAIHVAAEMDEPEDENLGPMEAILLATAEFFHQLLMFILFLGLCKLFLRYVGYPLYMKYFGEHAE